MRLPKLSALFGRRDVLNAVPNPAAPDHFFPVEFFVKRSWSSNAYTHYKILLPSGDSDIALENLRLKGADVVTKEAIQTLVEAYGGHVSAKARVVRFSDGGVSKEGEAVVYYQSGGKKTVTDFKDNKEHGVQELYNDEGLLLSITPFSKGHSGQSTMVPLPYENSVSVQKPKTRDGVTGEFSVATTKNPSMTVTRGEVVDSGVGVEREVGARVVPISRVEEDRHLSTGHYDPYAGASW